MHAGRRIKGEDIPDSVGKRYLDLLHSKSYKVIQIRAVGLLARVSILWWELWLLEGVMRALSLSLSIKVHFISFTSALHWHIDHCKSDHLPRTVASSLVFLSPILFLRQLISDVHSYHSFISFLLPSFMLLSGSSAQYAREPICWVLGTWNNGICHYTCYNSRRKWLPSEPIHCVGVKRCNNRYVSWSTNILFCRIFKESIADCFA